jgi:hypothetical protein
MIQRTTAVSTDVGDPFELISAKPPPMTKAAKAITKQTNEVFRAPLRMNLDCERSGRGPWPFPSSYVIVRRGPGSARPSWTNASRSRRWGKPHRARPGSAQSRPGCDPDWRPRGRAGQPERRGPPASATRSASSPSADRHDGQRRHDVGAVLAPQAFPVDAGDELLVLVEAQCRRCQAGAVGHLADVEQIEQIGQIGQIGHRLEGYFK